MNLTDFLLARLAEDEGTALYAQTRDDLQPEDWAGWWFGHHQHYSRHDPARVLADVESKRRIVTEVHFRAVDPRNERSEYLSDWQKDSCVGCGWGGPCDDYHIEHVNDCPTLRLLALPYADHPDYQEAWKP